MLISGRCHCGNISFTLDWRPEPSEIPARACTCSFCAKHGGVWTSCPTGSLTVSVKGPVCVSKYAFSTQYRPARLIESDSAPTKTRLKAQVASRLNQLRDTNLRPR
jgi:hypothetical protein